MSPENCAFLAAQTEEMKPLSNIATLKFLTSVNTETGNSLNRIFKVCSVLIFSNVDLQLQKLSRNTYQKSIHLPSVLSPFERQQFVSSVLFCCDACRGSPG